MLGKSGKVDNKFTFVTFLYNTRDSYYLESCPSSSKLIRREKNSRTMKAIIAAAIAAPFMAAPALAGPYVNIENNTGFTGSDYDGALTEFHVGYEGDLGESAGYYAQFGPAIVSVDGEENETELSGKAGVGVDLTENINVYGEISFVTDEDDNGYGTKVGVKYSF